MGARLKSPHGRQINPGRRTFRRPHALLKMATSRKPQSRVNALANTAYGMGRAKYAYMLRSGVFGRMIRNPTMSFCWGFPFVDEDASPSTPLETARDRKPQTRRRMVWPPDLPNGIANPVDSGTTYLYMAGLAISLAPFGLVKGSRN